ncbi:MAG TPA: hypothetical protein VMV23_00320 [Candidatus Nanopelagicaceae bacterium]|nr:hypothetical protein [Candidatus Nanopelagicaceae bacterium]
MTGQLIDPPGFRVLVSRPEWYDRAVVTPVCEHCGWTGPGCGSMAALGLEAARHVPKCPARLWGLAPGGVFGNPWGRAGGAG